MGETEISQIITQDKLRQNKKIILHLNLRNKSVRIQKIAQNEKKDGEYGLTSTTSKDCQNEDMVVENQTVKQPELQRSGRSRIEEKNEAPKPKPNVKKPKLKTC